LKEKECWMKGVKITKLRINWQHNIMVRFWIITVAATNLIVNLHCNHLYVYKMIKMMNMNNSRWALNVTNEKKINRNYFWLLMLDAERKVMRYFISIHLKHEN
jgi:hypothetical protein